MDISLYLNPHANLQGSSGIDKFSKEVLNWSKFKNKKIKLAGKYQHII